MVGAIGVVAALAGFVGGLMSPQVTIVVVALFFIVGTLLVNVFTNPPQKKR